MGQVDDAAAALLTPPMMAWARLNVEQQRPAAAQAPRLTYQSSDVASPGGHPIRVLLPAAANVKGVEGKQE